MPRLLALLALLLATFAHAESAPTPVPPSIAAPEVEGRYASIVVDADSLEILHARQIDELRYPASLTKVMTLFLVFDALAAGEITLDTPMRVSKTAASASPVKIHLKAGSTITVEDAIQAVAVRSANDAAVVLAEHLAGSEAAFAEAMTARARSLSMKATTFRTANGLPDPHQVTTARDMAKLASAVLRTYPEHYHWFGQTEFAYKGGSWRNTNGLLHTLPGVDGFKTGFTNDSGYNLIISAERATPDGLPRRLIAVVLGGASGKSRNAHMQDLVERSFERMGVAPSATPALVVEAEPRRRAARPETANTPETPARLINALSLRRSDGRTARIVTSGPPETAPALVAGLGERDWAIRVGRFPSVPAARDQLGALIDTLPALSRDKAVIHPTPAGYESRFTDLAFEDAEAACATLAGLAAGCSLIAPSRAR